MILLFNKNKIMNIFSMVFSTKKYNSWYNETSIKSLQKRNHCYNEIGKRCVIKTQSREVFKKYTGKI
jgi:hypothetical protein